ncbi:MAG: hypothetical protein ACREFF_02010 [Candidatus Udaeobacter sp.]
MGDRSPKSLQKQASQKQAENYAAKQQKGQAVVAKQQQAGKNSKRGR